MNLQEIIEFNRIIRRVLCKFGNTPQSREYVRELKEAIQEYERRWGVV